MNSARKESYPVAEELNELQNSEKPANPFKKNLTAVELMEFIKEKNTRRFHQSVLKLERQRKLIDKHSKMIAEHQNTTKSSAMLADLIKKQKSMMKKHLI